MTPKPASLSVNPCVLFEPSLAFFLLVICGFINIHPVTFFFILYPFSHFALSLPFHSYAFGGALPGHPGWSWCFLCCVPVVPCNPPFFRAPFLLHYHGVFICHYLAVRFEFHNQKIILFVFVSPVSCTNTGKCVTNELNTGMKFRKSWLFKLYFVEYKFILLTPFRFLSCDLEIISYLPLNMIQFRTEV